jgi:ribonuclease D
MQTVNLIETDKALAAWLDGLRSRGIVRLALDLEGDQGSVRYKYSIAIIQAYDGTDAVVIDVQKIGNNGALKAFLTSTDIIKVMFSCKNDMFMTQNVLGYSIERVRDIAVAQKMLGMKVNISEHIGIDKGKKDSFQRANWLKRPIRQDLLEYAVDDVLHLLPLEEKLAAELTAKKMFESYVLNSESIAKNDYVVDQFEQYKAKFPGYDRLREDKKELAGVVWAFRELLGEQFDCPVGYVLPKSAMNDIIVDKALVLEKLERELNRGRTKSKRIGPELIAKVYRKAVERRGPPPETN